MLEYKLPQFRIVGSHGGIRWLFLGNIKESFGCNKKFGLERTRTVELSLTITLINTCSPIIIIIIIIVVVVVAIIVTSWIALYPAS